MGKCVVVAFRQFRWDLLKCTSKIEIHHFEINQSLKQARFLTLRRFLILSWEHSPLCFTQGSGMHCPTLVATDWGKTGPSATSTWSHSPEPVSLMSRLVHSPQVLACTLGRRFAANGAL